MSTSYSGLVTQFQFGSADDSTGPVGFTITDIKNREYTGIMEGKIASLSSASYAIIFTIAMMNGYEVEVTSENSDSTYNRVVLLSPDMMEHGLDPISL
ncbi:hypothetical protein LJR230_000300 [Trinickia sp. LjRoot230]|uniref:hypothetical protein n=1 Tax=Trinickia sp. LjRoot230 TaxID=3342288 RepID=UPI003ECE136E